MYLSKENQSKLIDLLAEIYKAEPPKPKFRGYDPFNPFGVDAEFNPPVPLSPPPTIVVDGAIVSCSQIEWVAITINDGVRVIQPSGIVLYIPGEAQTEFLAYVLTTIPFDMSLPNAEESRLTSWNQFLKSYSKKDEVIKIAQEFLDTTATMQAEQIARYQEAMKEFNAEGGK